MKEYKIKEICEVIAGGTPSTQNSAFWGGNIVWLTPKDLSSNKNKYVFDSTNTITALGLQKSSAQILPVDTVLLSSRAPIGYLAIAGVDLCTNQGFKSMICDTSIVSPEYLYYYLSTKVEDLNNISTGSTFKELSGSLLKSYKITIHELDEQRHIVDILGSIDNKIENNERMRVNLIEYCTALYTNWSHKINCMVELGTVIDIFDSKRVPLSSRERSHRQGRYPYYGATGVLDYIDDFIFSGEYVLLAEDGTVVDNNGNPIVQLTNGNFWVNNHAHILRGKNGVSNYLLYLMLSNINVTSVITGAVQLKINQANMCKLLVPKPSNLCELNNVISPLFEKILSVEKENQKLNELKQLYLKKFFG